MRSSYPELLEKLAYVQQVIKLEEERFHVTLHDGMRIVEEMVNKLKAEGGNQISGQQAFTLYDTYGFPVDLTEDAAEEHGLTVDKAGFEVAMQEQRHRARAARNESGNVTQLQELYAELGQKQGPTIFLGYSEQKVSAKVTALVVEGIQVELAEEGEDVQVILDQTPFYGESGGQAGDAGYLTSDNCRIKITNTIKGYNNLLIHLGKMESGTIQLEEQVEASYDQAKRMATARNHTATHLLHKALKEVLGDHVNQAGSAVDPERLRFDFNHLSSLTAEELSKIEQRVNEMIFANLQVETLETGLEEARKMGATALFGEKYGDVVRIVRMVEAEPQQTATAQQAYSMELCGGTHLKATAQMGVFKIISEGGIGAGLRRIEAVTGKGTLQYFAEQETELALISNLVKAQGLGDLARKVEGLVHTVKEQERELNYLQSKLAKYEVDGLLEQVIEVQGVKVLAAKVAAPDMDALRSMGDMFRDKLGSGVVVLGAVAGEDKVNLLALVTKDLTAKGLHAGNIVKEVAKVTGGGGGGRPDLAQAGGKNPAKLDQALGQVAELVTKQIKLV